MEFFDQLFYQVLTYYKDKGGKGSHKKALSKAIYYISFLEVSLVLLLGVFAYAIIGRSYPLSLTPKRAWAFFIGIAIAIYFFNVLHYNGKRRMKIKGKLISERKKTTQIVVFWIVPLAIILLSIILLKAF